jgi:hypothetical protein
MLLHWHKSLIEWPKMFSKQGLNTKQQILLWRTFWTYSWSIDTLNLVVDFLSWLDHLFLHHKLFNGHLKQKKDLCWTMDSQTHVLLIKWHQIKKRSSNWAIIHFQEPLTNSDLSKIWKLEGNGCMHLILFHSNYLLGNVKFVLGKKFLSKFWKTENKVKWTMFLPWQSTWKVGRK